MWQRYKSSAPNFVTHILQTIKKRLWKRAKVQWWLTKKKEKVVQFSFFYIISTSYITFTHNVLGTLFQAVKCSVTRYSEIGFGELKNRGTATTLFKIRNKPGFVWLSSQSQQVSLRGYLATQNPICRSHVLLRGPANSLNASIKGDGTSLSFPETLCHTTLSPSYLPPLLADCNKPISSHFQLSFVYHLLHTSMLWGFVCAPRGLTSNLPTSLQGATRQRHQTPFCA